MKRKGISIFILFAFATLFLTSCKKDLVKTYYTIGNVKAEYSLGLSDWVGFENYMNNTVIYNQIMEFENETVEENNQQAIEFFNSEVRKINADTASSFIKADDYMVYGIGQVTEGSANQSYNILKGVTISANGVSEYNPE